MQKLDGDEEEQPSSTTSQLRGQSSTNGDYRPSASRHEHSLPPLVPADEKQDADLESTELKRFREQWRSELKKDQEQTPGASSSAPSSTASRQAEEKQFLRAAEEWKRQRELDRHLLQISRENIEPLPFAVPADEPLAIISDKPVELLHVSAIPDEVLIYLFCFLDETSLGHLALVCKKTYSVTREPVLWRLICQRNWPHNCGRDVYHKFSTWHRMFLNRPKTRFDGIFVSKNMYLRPGSTEWTFNQPVHQVVYYRYVRLMPDGRLLYAMALEPPRKVLKWFNPRTLELEKERLKGRDRSAPSTNLPSPGTYTLDDVTGGFEMWVQGKDMTQQFACALRRRQAGRFISISVTRYFGTSKTGITTDYDSVPIAPFHFFRLPPHVLDPREEQQQA